MTSRGAGDAIDRARIDVWLWRARFFKTRALAAALAGSGKIRLKREEVSSRIEKPGYRVRPGDILTFMVGGRARVIQVEGLGDRRGPAKEARTLYADLTEAAPPRGESECSTD